MADFLSHLRLAQPLYLWLLLGLPVLWLPWRRGAFVAVLWRSAVFCVLVLALTEPQRVERTSFATEPETIERVFAFDLSRSIPEAMRQWMVEKAKTDLAIKADERVFVFSREAREVRGWEKWLSERAGGESLGAERTDLEALFSALLRLPKVPRALFLFTDGWENQGSVARLFLSLPQSRLKVFPLVPAEPAPVANVSVNRVLGPRHGTSGEGIQLRAMVENHGAREAEGTLALRRNGELVKQEVVKVRPGSQIYEFQTELKDGPLAAFQVGFVPLNAALDRFPQDNQATGWVAVQNKDKVLLLGAIAAENRHLEEILRRRGFEVSSLARDGPPPAPAGYAAVIFNNVDKESFSPAYLAEIERQVAGGKAFVMLGGEGSFGPGGYRQTPIERILPVALTEPKKEERNRAVVLVIDKSGSMREEDKLLYAKEAAKAMALQLAERDHIGVVGFDVSPFVVVPLAPLERIRSSFASEVDRLQAGGKTYLLPAIVEAKRQLERHPASRKHVIILSDGETGGSGGDYIDLVTVMKAELRITISAVAIGDQANIPLLKRIAQYGGGLFHHTYDPKTLPRIVLEEIHERPQPEPLVEKDFVPVAVRGSEILSGLPFRSYPPVKGFIETEIKPGAKLDLVIPREHAPAPLLASRHYGNGKTVAFTTDLHGRWSKEWIGWERLERFWGGIFEWLIPRKEAVAAHEVRVNPQGEQTVLDFYLYEEKSDVGSFQYSFSGHAAAGEGTLKRLAPGRYRAELPIGAPGDYRIELVEERAGSKIPYPPVGYTLSFNPKDEIPRAAVNLPLLEQLARLSGGEINPKPADPPLPVDVRRSVRPYRTELTFLALGLLLIDFIVRRLMAARRG